MNNDQKLNETVDTNDVKIDDIGSNTVLEQELTICKEKSEEYLNGWKRTQADFINYKKEENKRMAEFVQFAGLAVISDVIEALDTLETTMQHVPKEVMTNNKSWYDGLQYILKEFQQFFKKYDVLRIQVAGVPFDPTMHEVVGGDAQNDATNKVMTEIRSGYMIHGRVIRPARVSINSK